MSAIRQQDLRRDLFTLAGDAMRGREAGTLDEMRASMWLADQMRQIGLAPHGDDGTLLPVVEHAPHAHLADRELR